MANEVIKNFLEHEYDKDANYNKIIKKAKKKTNYKKKILNIAATLIIVTTVGVLGQNIYAKRAWEIEYKEYQNRKVSTGYSAIDEAIANNYNQNINMEYVYQENIGIKIDSLMITDDHFQMNVNIKFDEDTKLNTETFSYGYAVYDEDNNVYGIYNRTTFRDDSKNSKYTNYYKYLYQELGIKYNKHDIYAGLLSNAMSTRTIQAVKGNIISETSIESSKGFPKSKKLYIRIFNLGYVMYEKNNDGRGIKAVDDFTFSDAEWIFEIDVPEKFYERETAKLKLANEVEGVKLEKAEVTETGLVIIANVKGLRDLILSGKDIKVEEFAKVKDNALYISDGDENIYRAKDLGTTSEEEMQMSFDISKTLLSKRLYLNINLNDLHYKIELIEQ